mmetsp:Transcript_37762/g.122102  ORF Transcript_37762/g.122102 Transcript_37762/m.122102 type:complete len:675 (+) Transcript_37762:219-2243(+)
MAQHTVAGGRNGVKLQYILGVCDGHPDRGADIELHSVDNHHRRARAPHRDLLLARLRRLARGRGKDRGHAAVKGVEVLQAPDARPVAASVHTRSRDRVHGHGQRITRRDLCAVRRNSRRRDRYDVISQPRLEVLVDVGRVRIVGRVGEAHPRRVVRVAGPHARLGEGAPEHVRAAAGEADSRYVEEVANSGAAGERHLDILLAGDHLGEEGAAVLVLLLEVGLVLDVLDEPLALERVHAHHRRAPVTGVDAPVLCQRRAWLDGAYAPRRSVQAGGGRQARRTHPDFARLARLWVVALDCGEAGGSGQLRAGDGETRWVFGRVHTEGVRRDKGGGVQGDARARHVVGALPDAVDEGRDVGRPDRDDGLVELGRPAAERLARRVVCVEVDARLDGVHPLHHGVVVHVALAHLDVSCPKRRPGELETFRWAEVGVVAGHVVVELCLEEAESLEPHGRCGVEAHVRVNHELVGRRVAVRHLEVARGVVGQLNRREGGLLVDGEREGDPHRPDGALAGHSPRHSVTVEHTLRHPVKGRGVGHVHHCRRIDDARAVALEREWRDHHPADRAAIRRAILGRAVDSGVEGIDVAPEGTRIVDLNNRGNLHIGCRWIRHRRRFNVDRGGAGEHVEDGRHDDVPDDRDPEQRRKRNHRQHGVARSLDRAAEVAMRLLHAPRLFA